MFSCDLAARKVSNPVPISKMRKLTSKEAKTGLVRDEGNTWLTAGFYNEDVGLRRAVWSIKAEQSPELPSEWLKTEGINLNCKFKFVSMAIPSFFFSSRRDLQTLGKGWMIPTCSKTQQQLP